LTGAAAEPTTNKHEQVLSIPVDTVYFIIGKLRDCDSKDVLAEPAENHCPSDSESVEAPRAQGNGCQHATVLQELHSLIDDLREDQQVDLVALTWLGRDHCSATDWSAIRGDTAEVHYAQTARYLLGMSMVGNFLQEGLSTLGFSGEPVREPTFRT
jgi:glyoxylase-like metal-dependent hydrolase (beta-lactamase superfamily II)